MWWYIDIVIHIKTGICDSVSYLIPECVNCNNSMGDACQYDCYNGKEYLRGKTH